MQVRERESVCCDSEQKLLIASNSAWKLYIFHEVEVRRSKGEETERQFQVREKAYFNSEQELLINGNSEWMVYIFHEVGVC